MDKNDLYLNYAEIIKMCKGTALEDKPWVCVKFEGNGIWHGAHPHFDNSPESYEFAIAILEDRAVFVGDSLYHPSGAKWIVGGTDDLTGMSWQPPKPKRRIVLEETGDIRFVKKGEYAEVLLDAPPASLPKLFMWDCNYSSASKYKIWRIVKDTGNKL